MTAALKVIRAGLFDTVQDLGRIGFMALGMPTAGAMDRIALTLANALAGNPALDPGFTDRDRSILLEGAFDISALFAANGKLDPAFAGAPVVKVIADLRSHLKR